MKIHRGPRTAAAAKQTAEKSASEIEANWAPGTILYFDGTIDKSGTRHTDIGVEIEEADIAALARAFFRHWAKQKEEYQIEVEDREQERIRTRTDLEAAEGAIRRLNGLAWQAHRAPSTEAFGEAVRAIVQHYEASLHSSGEPVKPPSLKWIKWTSL